MPERRTACSPSSREKSKFRSSLESAPRVGVEEERTRGRISDASAEGSLASNSVRATAKP